MASCRLRIPCGLLLAGVIATGAPVSGQEPTPPSGPRFRFQVETKAGVRHSKDARFDLTFPFPPEFVPQGEAGVALRTVDPGTSIEIANVALLAEAELTPHLRARAEVHIVDLYSRNPTSADDLVSLREAWLLAGLKQDTLTPIPGTTLYAQFGKAWRFSKPLDRRLQSYGLLGTAVGRFEQVGLQLGGSFGKHVYWRAHAASGNPVFFRDPNALAGDNGAPERTPGNPDPVLQPGFPILYDTKAQEIDLDGRLELGGGLGARFVFERDGKQDGVDLLGWYFRRDLEDRARMRNNVYEGDLDLLGGAGIPLPFRGREKWEAGVNLAARVGDFHLAGQYLAQSIAELDRHGFEVEISYRIPLNGLFASGDEPVFNWIEPVVRHSRLDSDFTVPPDFIAPSMGWPWRKYDIGLRLGIVRAVDLTLEYARHNVVTGRGTLHPDEALLTLRTTF